MKKIKIFRRLKDVLWVMKFRRIYKIEFEVKGDSIWLRTYRHNPYGDSETAIADSNYKLPKGCVWWRKKGYTNVNDDTFTIHYHMTDDDDVTYNCKYDLHKDEVFDVIKNQDNTAYVKLNTCGCIKVTDNYDDVVNWWKGGNR